MLLQYLVKVETVEMYYYSGILPKQIALNVSYMLHRKFEMDLYITKFRVLCTAQHPNFCATMRVRNKDLWHLWPAKALFPQTLVNSEQNVIEAVVDSIVSVWDHVCMLLLDTSNTCCEMIVHLYDVVYQNILRNYQRNSVHLTAVL